MAKHHKYGKPEGSRGGREPAYMRKAREEQEQRRAEHNTWQPLPLSTTDFNVRPVHHIPVPQTAVDLAMGMSREHWPRQETVPEEFRKSSHPLNRAADTMFFKGGGLEAVQRKPKPGFTTRQIEYTLAYLLRSFDPSHELKAATVAWALHCWTDPQ